MRRWVIVTILSVLLPGSMYFQLGGRGEVAPFYAQLDATSGDICQKINHLAVSVVPSTGGWISADNLGVQACSVNPFASVTSSGIRLTMTGTQLQAAVTWNIPNGSVLIEGGGQGGAARGSTIQAQAGFTGSYVITFGSSAGIGQSVKIRNLTIDVNANNVAAIGCIENQFDQELSDFSDITCNNLGAATGFHFGSGGSFGGGQNSGSYRNLNIQTVGGTNGATSATRCIVLDSSVASMRRISGVTCNNTPNVSAPTYGITIDGSGYIDDVHCQGQATACIAVGVNNATSGTVDISNVDGSAGSGQTPDGVLLSNANNVQKVRVFGVKNFASHSLIDQGTGCTTGTTSIGEYRLGSSNGTNYQRTYDGTDSGCASNFGYLGITSLTSNVTAQTTSQTTVTLATTPIAGEYSLHYYANQNGLCSSGAETVSFTFNWTDAGNARSATTGNLLLGTAQSTTTGYLSGVIGLQVNSGNVTYTSTINGSCSGASYDIHAGLVKIQ